MDARQQTDAADWLDVNVSGLLVMALLVAAMVLWPRLALSRRPGGRLPRLG